MTLDLAVTRPTQDVRTSIVICAYSELRWIPLRSAVQAVLDQSPPPDEVIVVVDHNDQLLELVRGEFSDVRVVASAAPPGLSGARNTGVAASRNPIVVFLDDDALPTPDWLAKLVEPYVDESVVATGGRCTPAWSGDRPRWFPDEFDWVVGCSYRGMPETLGEIRNPIGAAMSIRRSALEIAGLFREDIGRIGKKPVGCEETELSIRIQQRLPGCRILYVPDAEVAHFVTVDREGMSYFLRRCHAEGISKTLVTGSVGTGDGLASERRYATRTLPLGVIRGVREALRGDLAGLARSAAIIVGLAATAAGYASGLVARRVSPA